MVGDGMAGGQKAEALSDPELVNLWSKIIDLQGQPLMTSGRGSSQGKPFTYRVSKSINPETGKEEFGSEIFVDRRSKSITRATVIYAYQKVQKTIKQGGEIKGPKAIGVHGDSYIYAIFKALGLFRNSDQQG